MTKPVKVLVVDDSATARQLLTHLINRTSDLQAVAEARDGQEAVRLAERLRPDVILMDVTMPRMDGLEATRVIMEQSPTPIVVVSASFAGRETEIAFQALRLGALTVLPKPAAPRTPEDHKQIDTLLNTLRTMAEVRVIHHRWKHRTTVPAPAEPQVKPTVSLPVTTVVPEIVGIVSSTGGPAALCEILGKLPPSFYLPIAVVQHIAPDFLHSLVDWLASVTSLRMRIAEQGEQPQPRTVYFAPAQAHLALTRRRFDCAVKRPTRHVPSGDVLLESIAASYRSQAIGVVLTGMGDDGAQGLRMMREAGAVTIAQDEETSIVYGMPHEAVQLDAAQHVLPLPEISGALAQFSQRKPRRES